jgi:hypothetical protein
VVRWGFESLIALTTTWPGRWGISGIRRNSEISGSKGSASLVALITTWPGRWGISGIRRISEISGSKGSASLMTVTTTWPGRWGISGIRKISEISGSTGSASLMALTTTRPGRRESVESGGSVRSVVRGRFESPMAGHLRRRTAGWRTRRMGGEHDG